MYPFGSMCSSHSISVDSLTVSNSIHRDRSAQFEGNSALARRSQMLLDPIQDKGESEPVFFSSIDSRLCFALYLSLARFQMLTVHYL